jgi:hypothetical protein
VVSPPYTAVKLFVPNGSNDVVKDAWPPARGAPPITVKPSKKVTEPVASDGVTVAVRVTGTPNVCWLADVASETITGFPMTKSS